MGEGLMSACACRLDMRLWSKRSARPARSACRGAIVRSRLACSAIPARQAPNSMRRCSNRWFARRNALASWRTRRAGELTDAAAPTLDGLLSLRGVIETAEPEEDDSAQKARQAAILSDLEDVIGNVIAARKTEGAHIASSLSAHLEEIENLVGTIERAPSRTPEAIAKRLRERLEVLLGEAPQLDEQRLHQEAVLLAVKADVMEEIDRLKAHLEAARELLKSDKPAGRRLDFLTQEFNREANTICSKSNDIDVTQAGLALKVAIDRMREQVQNIE